MGPKVELVGAGVVVVLAYVYVVALVYVGVVELAYVYVVMGYGVY